MHGNTKCYRGQFTSLKRHWVLVTPNSEQRVCMKISDRDRVKVGNKIRDRDKLHLWL